MPLGASTSRQHTRPPARADALADLVLHDADGNHARADAYVSLGVILSAVVVALGFDVADPLIALAITAVILRITWQSWHTIRHGIAHA